MLKKHLLSSDSALKTVVQLHIFVEAVIFFFRILSWTESSK